MFAKRAYAPTKMYGDVIVDDVVVSNYTGAVHPATANRLLVPMQWMYGNGLHGIVRTMCMFETDS